MIVMEGGDGAGKTTQARMLVESLKAKCNPAVYLKWPDRETGTGKIINGWLTGAVKLPKEATNLLFLANLWELAETIEMERTQGRTVVVDRYAMSNIVYSMSFGCSRAEAEIPTLGLPQPDFVFLFDIDPSVCMSRKKEVAAVLEVTETMEVQNKVRKLYLALKKNNCYTIDANRPVDQIHQEVMEKLKDSQ